MFIHNHTISWNDRFSTKQTLRHPYFSELREAEIRAIKARQGQSVSGMSSVRGSALLSGISGRQQLFGKVCTVVCVVSGVEFWCDPI